MMKNLEIISRQTYDKLEVVISDDCSTDNTSEEIARLIPQYKFPLIYHRFEKNQGYDRNLRKSIELSSGDYIIVVGNDDSINDQYDLAVLVKFLTDHQMPEIGFANFIEDGNKEIYRRATQTAVLGSGVEVALKYYSCFSFVGGILFRKDKFVEFNTDKYDGSIYSQIYLAALMVSSGCRLFSIAEPLVIKDIQLEEAHRNSYRDVLIKNWKDYRKTDGGLRSVIHVLVAALKDAGVSSQKWVYAIFRKIYFSTLPFWILDYKSNKAFPNSVSIMQGMHPPRVEEYRLLNWVNRLRIYLLYLVMSTGALLFPVFLFRKIKASVYNLVKK